MKNIQELVSLCKEKGVDPDRIDLILQATFGKREVAAQLGIVLREKGVGYFVEQYIAEAGSNGEWISDSVMYNSSEEAQKYIDNKLYWFAFKKEDFRIVSPDQKGSLSA